MPKKYETTYIKVYNERSLAMLIGFINCHITFMTTTYKNSIKFNVVTFSFTVSCKMRNEIPSKAFLILFSIVSLKIN